MQELQDSGQLLACRPPLVTSIFYSGVTIVCYAVAVVLLFLPTAPAFPGVHTGLVRVKLRCAGCCRHAGLIRHARSQGCSSSRLAPLC